MRRWGLIRRTIAVVTLGCFSVGCYTHRPLSTPVPTPETRVVAQVTDTGAVVLASDIGPGALEVEGVVAEADAETWKLQLTRVTQRDGTSSMWSRELVAFPRYALTNAREKRLDKNRSWIVAGVLTAAVITVTLLFGSVLGGEENGGSPEPPA